MGGARGGCWRARGGGGALREARRGRGSNGAVTGRAAVRPGPGAEQQLAGVGGRGSRRAQLAAPRPRVGARQRGAGTDGFPHLAWGFEMERGNRSLEDGLFYQALSQLRLFSRLQVAWTTLR